MRAENHGCPEGTQFWQRDLLTELCATPCTSDADCAPEEGRCRVIDVFDESNVPAAPLVDDTAPEEIDALLTDESRPEPPLLLCDPFYDLTDVPDLELFEVVGAGRSSSGAIAPDATRRADFSAQHRAVSPRKLRAADAVCRLPECSEVLAACAGILAPGDQARAWRTGEGAAALSSTTAWPNASLGAW